jgi:phosphopantothenoylcysteine decarboxylase/phosphopantothenate--cysteine ligase
VKIVITAGPTREAIDPVRFLSNRSSGKMGYAIAEAAAGRGHEVCLISGPVALKVPDRVRLINVISAKDMLDAVIAEFQNCEVLIMAAAVADWRPVNIAEHKLKKVQGRMSVELERTQDILLRVAEIKQSQIVVGFAAETRNLLEEARRKLKDKRLDMIVANDVSRSDAGFGSDNNAVTFLTEHDTEELPLMKKSDVAARLLERVERLG